VYLKFGHEFDAAWNIRQSYFLVQECKKKFPTYLPIKKTSGVLEVMLGSVPEKYQWVINLLGMQGSIEEGLQELGEVKDKSNSLHIEATILYYLIQGYILQQTEVAVNGLHHDLEAWPDNRLAIFFRASLAIKNSQSEKALASLLKLKKSSTGLPIAYLYYQLGEVYLHKGEYEAAIQSYETFLNEYHGLNYIKDAHYKTGICYWLAGNTVRATSYFKEATTKGKESTEADKYAARSLAEATFPNVKLSKIRYATDGGYYDYAKKVVISVSENELTSPKDRVEFIYRKARLFDKSGDHLEAVKFYKETISLQQEENWYFAPNACLQLGYILLDLNKSSEARQHFEMALSYKKHEYKNSIDSKAKSALAQLNKKAN
jgi:tetratricopeptide (TPR) repeat protein